MVYRIRLIYTFQRLNIENNSFIDYLAGRKAGYYWPNLLPTYQKKNNETNKKRIDYMNIMTEEAWRQCVRKGMGNSLI